MTRGKTAGPRIEESALDRVVRLTPPGPGAVAVVLVEGPRATELVATNFAAHNGRPLAEIPLSRIVLGRWGGPEGEELIVCRRRPTAIEVHPHGGEAAIENVIRPLVDQGAVEWSWESWTVATHTCPLRAAAQRALADAATQRTAQILLDQFQGALRGEIERAIAGIESGSCTEAREVLQGLAGRCEMGLHLVQPWQVVLAGPPNVGKSSLTNALVGYERSIVYDQPGTTRDVVAVRTAVAGWPIELSDTAGLRESDDPLELAGVRLAEAKLSAADAILFVLDASAPLEDLARQIAARLKQAASRRVLIALNKIDLLAQTQRDSLEPLLREGAYLTSATTREGIDGLISGLSRLLVPDPPRPWEAVPFLQYHREQIHAAIAELDSGDAASAADALQVLLARDPSQASPTSATESR